jgi:hypothetical protein
MRPRRNNAPASKEYLELFGPDSRLTRAVSFADVLCSVEDKLEEPLADLLGSEILNAEHDKLLHQAMPVAGQSAMSSAVSLSSLLSLSSGCPFVRLRLFCLRVFWRSRGVGTALLAAISAAGAGAGAGAGVGVGAYGRGPQDIGTAEGAYAREAADRVRVAIDNTKSCLVLSSVSKRRGALDEELAQCAPEPRAGVGAFGAQREVDGCDPGVDAATARVFVEVMPGRQEDLGGTEGRRV